MLSTHKQSWEDLAATDPLWAILSNPSKKNGRWDIDEFFATGERDIARAMAPVEAKGLPLRHGRALDFGCGVGRLTRALASRFEQCVGVDISAQMVEQAKRLNADRKTCRFVTNVREDLSCFESGSFDFIHTQEVLQHLVHRDSMIAYIREFFRLLAPGGVAAFQVPSYIAPVHRLQPVPRTYDLFRRLGVSHGLLSRVGLHPIRMAFLTPATVLKLADDAGITVVESEELPVRDFRNTFYWMTR